MSWRTQLLPSMAPGAIRRISPTVAPARAADGGLAAVAFYRNNEDGCPVSLNGGAEAAQVNGLHMFARVAAIPAFGQQLRGRRLVLAIDNYAAAGTSIKASRVPVAPVLVESFWGSVAQLPASCWVERASAKAGKGRCLFNPRLQGGLPQSGRRCCCGRPSGAQKHFPRISDKLEICLWEGNWRIDAMSGSNPRRSILLRLQGAQAFG